MRRLPEPLSQIVKAPGAFALRALKGFRANQGLLLAGAVAYYALLPGQAKPVIVELETFIVHREVLGWVLLGTMLLSLEAGATLLLFGAQVISEYERLARGSTRAASAR